MTLHQSYGMSLAVRITESHSFTCHPTQVNTPALTPANVYES